MTLIYLQLFSKAHLTNRSLANHKKLSSLCVAYRMRTVVTVVLVAWSRAWAVPNLLNRSRCPSGCGTTYYFGVRITITGKSTLVDHTWACPDLPAVDMIFSTVFARGQKLCGFWLPVYRSKLLSLLCSLQTHVKSKNCSSLLTSPTLRLRTIVLDLAWCVTI